MLFVTASSIMMVSGDSPFQAVTRFACLTATGEVRNSLRRHLRTCAGCAETSIQGRRCPVSKTQQVHHCAIFFLAY